MIGKILALFSSNYALYQKIEEKGIHLVGLDDQDSISASGIFKFHQLIINDRGLFPTGLDIHTARFKTGRSELFKLMDMVNDMFQEKDIPNFTIDISELAGFSASKSDLSKYRTMDQFAESATKNYINEISLDRLNKMLGHKEIRLIHGATDTFIQYAWNPKIFVLNGGGSHHLAAAQYIAKRLNQKIAFTSTLKLKYIDQESFNKFDEQYESFVLDKNHLLDLIRYFNDSDIKFVKYELNPRSEPGREISIYFFKKTKENERIIEIFSKKFNSLNKILERRIKQQKDD